MRHFAAYLTPLALKRQILLSFHVKLTRSDSQITYHPPAHVVPGGDALCLKPPVAT